MTNAHEIREQAEILLELSNSILSAAIGGYWDEMDELEHQRTALFERMLGVDEVSGADRIFLVGVMEHIRVVDATVRKFIGAGQATGWLAGVESGFDILSDEDLALLAIELAGPPDGPASREPLLAYQ
ncbi:hypothetical protein SAMN02949497_3142 [Methylomagnum ishizawai]|uniref:Uncharacterized protein n=1 Tax=Methylomagnum ishizawai TaxID=1760988 RepID=A0A1Y6CYM6_9GAMM|nr:hypothetical protein [Methylomagnum ishizawai]SMF95768.1 hypothetical protein SAMN02949497_3142 [Methylomagnum ishizawai]